MSEIIFLSERGWQGMRSCALNFSKEGKLCRVFVKGQPSLEVRNFISQKPNIINYFISRPFFHVYFIFYFVFKRILRKNFLVIAQHPRTLRFLSLLPLKFQYECLEELPKPPYYRLPKENGNEVS